MTSKGAKYIYESNSIPWSFVFLEGSKVKDDKSGGKVGGDIGPKVFSVSWSEDSKKLGKH